MYDAWLDANHAVRWINLVSGGIMFWGFIWIAMFTRVKKQWLVSHGFRILAFVEFLLCYMSAAALSIKHPAPTGTGFVALTLNVLIVRLLFYLIHIRKTNKSGTLLEL